jgi:hypothetical protein
LKQNYDKLLSISHKFAFNFNLRRYIMARRRVPCLDHYLDGVAMALWPRFKTVFDAHLKSVGDASASPAGLAALWAGAYTRSHFRST